MFLPEFKKGERSSSSLDFDAIREEKRTIISEPAGDLYERCRRPKFSIAV